MTNLSSSGSQMWSLGTHGAVVRALSSDRFGLGSIPGPGARFSKARETFRGRKAWNFLCDVSLCS